MTKGSVNENPIEKGDFTINICPHWIDIIDIMLEVWNKRNLEREQRDDLRKNFIS